MYASSTLPSISKYKGLLYCLNMFRSFNKINIDAKNHKLLQVKKWFLFVTR